MKITPVNNSNQQSFTSSLREVKDSTRKVVYKNVTGFFRADLNWDKFSTHLIENYKDQKKVNVYCYACSDGSEPYSLAMILIKKLGEKAAQKFFPIIAADIDEFMINKAKSGLIDVQMHEPLQITLSGIDIHKHIRIGNTAKRMNGNYFYDGSVAENLKKNVIFRQADIVDDIDKIDAENSVVMFRNVWPYLKPEQREKLIKKLDKNLGKTSMYVFGGFDVLGLNENKDFYLQLKLMNSGFSPTAVDRCYQKTTPNKRDYLSNPQFMMSTFAKTTP